MKYDKKKKKQYLIIAAISLVLVFCLGISYAMLNKEEGLNLYKSAYFDDCAHVKKDADTQIDLTGVLDKNSLVGNVDEIDYNHYEKSRCVVFGTTSIKGYAIIKDKPINHVKGQNNAAYQLSYLDILDFLDKKPNKSKFDQQVIQALNYYLNDSLTQANVSNDKHIFENRKIVGPSADDPSGTYYPVIDLNILVNNIYRENDGNKEYVSTKYTLDDISTHYERVGE